MEIFLEAVGLEQVGELEGADRAALDNAITSGIDDGGWCPKGRKAEDGPIDRRYRLEETPSAHCVQRTEWNVRDSDGTVILTVADMRVGALRRAIQAEIKPARTGIFTTGFPATGVVTDPECARP